MRTNRKTRRIVALLLTLCMSLSLLPMAAFADNVSAAAPVYVSNGGNDATGNGTQASPYATLKKAVEEAEDGATIYVMSNLIMMDCARYYSKNLTIMSTPGNQFTITRGTSFNTISDKNRSWYNPAMIEVCGTPGTRDASLRLENIILDDAGSNEGTKFIQAGSDTGDNTAIVQDAIIATYDNTAVITLGSGTVLKNFGGMSAVRMAGGSLVMESGSKIIDDTVTDRKKSDKTDFGAAGAVWLQGGEIEMKEGAEISNVVGRAVYADGGKVTIDGTISGIKSDKDMWQGTSGAAIHLRNGATGTLNGSIEKSSGDGNLIWLQSTTFEMTSTAKITSLDDAGDISWTGGVIYAEGNAANNAVVNLDGEIAYAAGGNKNHVLQTGGYTVTTVGKTGNIHHNRCTYGTLYLNGDKDILYLYGKVNDNYTTDRGGGVVLSNNGSNKTAVMYDGAEIIGNISTETGGGLMVSCGTFTMEGGEISGNISTGEGGGVYVRRGGQFIMKGGVIKDNSSASFGGSIAFSASDYGGLTPYVDIQKGEISGNKMNATVTLNGFDTTAAGGVTNDIAIAKNDYSKDSRYLKFGSAADIGSLAVYFVADNKTVTPVASMDIKLGNASPDSNTALKNDSNGKGWSDPLATFWTQRNGSADMTVEGLTLDGTLPVYILTQETGADGKPAANAPVNLYAATVDNGKVTFTLPGADVSDDGCAVAIVQPSADYGTLTVTADPVTMLEDATAGTYTVIYTATFTPSTSFISMTDASLDNLVFTPAADSRFDMMTTPSKQVESTSATWTFTATLDKADFEAGGSLYTGGTVSETAGVAKILVPAVPCETKMVGVNTVTFDANGGTFADGNSTKDVVVVDGEAVDVPTAPTLSGYTFAGWTLNGSAYDFTAPVKGNLTLVAQWNKNPPVVTKYILTYESNGGTVFANEIYVDGDIVTLDKVPTREGYTFTGWYSDKETTKQIISVTMDRNRTVYAGWQAVEEDDGDATRCTLSYESNGGTEYARETYSYGKLVSLDKEPTREGYTFTGWYSDKGTTHKIVAVTMNGDKTVYAGWRFNGPLNADDHVAYVRGYTDGTVGPTRNITRAETAVMLYRLLTPERSAEITTTANAFCDVPATIWYNKEASSMAKGGYVTGYKDGTFGGEKSITRAEFVTMLVRFIGPAVGTMTFIDVPETYWAYESISTATAAGWIVGYGDGRFGPEKPITRAEAMTIINRVLNRGVDGNSELLGFKKWVDNKPSDWFYYDVIEATNSHEYTGARPSENWTKILK